LVSITSSHSASVTSTRRSHQRAAGVVDQQVDLAEARRRTLEAGLDADLRAQVERGRDDLAAGDGGIGQRRLEHGGVELGQRQVVALARQRNGDGAAESGRGAGDESRSVCHVLKPLHVKPGHDG
jgi:hypothetical protein